MNWKDMQVEMVKDIGDILITSAMLRPVNTIIAIVQWQGKQIARLAYASSMVLEDKNGADGMTILPEPSPLLVLPWREVESIFKPKVRNDDGTFTYIADDMPLSYYVMADDDTGEHRAVCVPRRFNGQVTYVNNVEQVEQVQDFLAVAGVLKLVVKK